ncbi:MAG: calcium-binding protein, partial [Candidatus Binatia bacterium]
SLDEEKGAGADKLIGGEANDKLYGGFGDDFLYGDFEGRDDAQANGWDELWGHAGHDHLFGGRGDDKLYGGDGADWLEGGLGNDWLEGGAGNDTYVFGESLGVDTIVDSDGQGSVQYNGTGLNGGAKVGANHWKSGGIDYFLADGTVGGTLEVWLTNQARIEIRNWSPGHLGITLEGTSPPPQSFDRTILGDRVAVEPQALDDLGNYVIYPEAVTIGKDTLYDSTGNDHILYGLEREHVNAFRGGDDRIESGFADWEDFGSHADFIDDWILAGPGKDTVIAATGMDVVMGGADDDHLYSREFREEDEARTLGETDAAFDAGWDWLSGEGGDDVLVGHPGKDLLWGGKGEDRIYGGAGNDDIAGDYTPVFTPSPYKDAFGEYYYHGTSMVIGVTREVVKETDNLTIYKWKLLNFTTPDDSDPGKDIVYGGAGADWIFGGGGDDYLDGGADGDVVFGESGGDSLHGGDGDDSLNGDDLDTVLAADQHGGDEVYGGKGEDWLWGNGGDDRLFGEDGKDYLDGDDSTTDPEFHGFDYLEGGPGDDTLLGEGKGDVLFGDAGDDIMHGDGPKLDPAYAGGDYLFGGSGKDTMVGGAGDDELYGEDGDDQMDGDNGAETLAGEHHGTDYLVGGAGDDELRGGGKDDHLYGGTGDDRLWGDADDVGEEFHGGDRLYGEAGDDQLVGDGGDDYLVGGLGVDYLEGAKGDDRYAFSKGDSPLRFNTQVETLIDEPGANVIEFGFGIESRDLDVTTAPDGVSLILRYSADDALYISDGLNGTIAEFRFAGGSSLSLSELLGQQLSMPVIVTVDQPDQTLLGGAGSDTFTATGGATVFHGGRGDDLMIGEGGANRYQIGLGDGRDRIVDTGGQRDAADQLLPNRLELGAGIARSDLRLGVGDGLVVKIGTEDEVVLSTFDPADVLAARTIDEFVFADSTTVTYEELVAQGFDIQGTAGADLLTGTNLVDRISGGEGADILEAGAGDDTLEGGAGDDVLKGGAGNDVYRFAPGFGRDVIDNEDAGAERHDAIELDGIFPTELALRREADDLVIAVLDADDAIRVPGFFVNDGANARRIDEIRFGPGLEDFAVTLDDIKAAVLFGGATDDRLVGYGSDDLLYGAEGADTLEGAAGADSLDGGAGEDTLRGGAGADTYAFFPGAGHDTIDAPAAEAG